jgi:hypothetical protein
MHTSIMSYRRRNSKSSPADTGSFLVRLALWFFWRGAVAYIVIAFVSAIGIGLIEPYANKRRDFSTDFHKEWKIWSDVVRAKVDEINAPMNPERRKP